MKSVMNYAAMSIRRLTDNVPFRMAILGPSPPYEYPVDEQVEQVDEVIAKVVRYMTWWSIIMW